MIRNLTILLVLLYSLHVSAEERILQFPRFGKIHVYTVATHSRDVVILLSGGSGWGENIASMAVDLTSGGAMVVGVDIRQYLDQLKQPSKGCSYPAADLEDLSKFVQKSYESSAYKIPFLAGFSSGATLAYVALVQAPSNTFAGGVGVDFSPDLRIAKSFCKGKGLEWTTGSEPGVFHFLPAKSLEEPWISIQESSPKEWAPQFKGTFAKLFSAKPTGLHPAESIPASAEVKDLPLIELPVKTTDSRSLAIIVSGDGGWANIDREIGNYLSEKGIPVVGWNSLQYFWKKRTPEESAKDLKRILEHYLATWKKGNAILIGYSFGADVLPFMVSRLPAELQQKVQVIALLGLDKEADFEFHVTDWINVSSDTASPTQPEIEKIKGPHVLCFYGENETDSLCTTLDPKVAIRIPISGGHHFGGDYQGIALRILSEASS